MEIAKTYTLPFSQDTVYSAWVSSNTVIAPATAMDIDPRVGGHYRLIIEGGEFSGRNEGKFLTVDAPHHVRYTWEWNKDGENTTIDVTFKPVSQGTQIDISHTGFTKADSVGNHDSGWDSYIDGFTQYLNERTQ